MYLTDHLFTSTALHTYRNLPTYLKRLTSIKEVMRVLRVRDNMFQQMSYTEKCLLEERRLIIRIQRRLRKNGYPASKQLLTNIFRAEEVYFRQVASIYDPEQSLY